MICRNGEGVLKGTKKVQVIGHHIIIMARTTDVKLEYTLLQGHSPQHLHQLRGLDGSILSALNPVPSSNTYPYQELHATLTEETLKSPIPNPVLLCSSPPRSSPSRSDSIPNTASAPTHASFWTISLRVTTPRRTALLFHRLSTSGCSDTLTTLEGVASPTAVV